MNKIKEKLCKREDLSPNICEGGEDYKERLIEIVIEETSKAKDEEFIKILGEIKNKIKLIENTKEEARLMISGLDIDEYIEEIKQRIKEE